jgi:hypothetical protein
LDVRSLLASGEFQDYWTFHVLQERHRTHNKIVKAQDDYVPSS